MNNLRKWFKKHLFIARAKNKKAKVRIEDKLYKYSHLKPRVGDLVVDLLWFNYGTYEGKVGDRHAVRDGNVVEGCPMDRLIRLKPL